MKTIMKALLIVATIFAVNTSVLAGTGATMQDLISDNLHMPAELKSEKLNEKVKVSFRIDASGKASIVEIGTQNEELKRFVTKQFNSIDFSKAVDSKQDLYFVDISFKVL
jgi:hypothetical protein